MNDSTDARKYKMYSIISLALGISGLAFFIIHYFIYSLYWGGYVLFQFMLLSMGAMLIAGIILGIKGKRSIFSGVAIAGILLCTISIVFWLLLVGWYILYLL